MKDELTKLGLELFDCSAAPSENLQKWARQSMRRSSNGHNDALVQVAKLFARQMQHLNESLDGKFLIDPKILERNKNKEKIRHGNLFVGHKCIKEKHRSWITTRFEEMRSKGILQPKDVVGIDVFSLVKCPFCCTLSSDVNFKLGPRPSTVVVEGPEGPIAKCNLDSDSDDESYETVDSSNLSELPSDIDTASEDGELE